MPFLITDVVWFQMNITSMKLCKKTYWTNFHTSAFCACIMSVMMTEYAYSGRTFFLLFLSTKRKNDLQSDSMCSTSFFLNSQCFRRNYEQLCGQLY